MAWLDGFQNRFKMTIAASDVDNTLSDFPVMISLTSDSGKNNFDTTPVFDELSQDDRKKIAVTTSDGTTQCPVEIEYWNNTEERAVLWTKIPSVYSTTDTELYFYYDATYSGTTVSGNTGYVAEVTDTTYQMIVNYNVEGTYDTVHVSKPSVIKESETSYKMWYSGSDGSHYRIMYATSIDGINWSGNQMVINYGSQGTYDTLNANNPFVIKESDTSYKMWYSGSNGVNIRIIYATSTDGINWSNFQMVINVNEEGNYDTDYVWTPFVIKESNTSYKIWYSCFKNDGHYRIMYATSTDGINWSNFQMVLSHNSEGTYDTTHAYSPCVIKESDDFYRMWYSGYDGSYYRIIYAESSNGVTWGNFEMVLDKNMEGTYDTQRAYHPFVLKEDINKMWYSSRDASHNRIMHATYWRNPVWDVWDDNYLAVWHFEQDPSGGTDAIKDSTRNAIHGTTGGSMVPSNLIDCKIGKGLDLDGGNDYITVGSEILESQSNVSFEAVVKFIGIATDSQGCIYRENDNGWNGHGFEFTVGENSRQLIFTADQGYPPAPPHVNSVNTVSFDTWYCCGATYSKGGNGVVYLNGVKETTVGQTSTTITSDFNGTIGWYDNTTGVEDWNDMEICELRLSATQRSDAWMKATYHSAWDNFITYSGIESIVPIFTFSGYVQVEGVSSARTVHLFRRSTGELMDTTLSNASTGYFELNSYYNDYHFIVILPLLTETYNLLSYDKIDPGV